MIKNRRRSGFTIKKNLEQQDKLILHSSIQVPRLDGINSTQILQTQIMDTHERSSVLNALLPVRGTVH
ncbi:hypothetical protein [Oscillatoria acuminata]|uniref:Uncharacterized protein n=1 Tax=Oscillatoria acuminata PCC 6304 TaxID=56110 RepID=K9TJ73_9CYAN|nr:hypothetical protein [Oscillatoria acuminata]AFY82882.1 hypothetical protein Oscil6304_3308 [Oscillatoria acuminata PCC 6304]